MILHFKFCQTDSELFLSLSPFLGPPQFCIQSKRVFCRGQGSLFLRGKRGKEGSWNFYFLRKLGNAFTRLHVCCASICESLLAAAIGPYLEIDQAL